MTPLESLGNSTMLMAKKAAMKDNGNYENKSVNKYGSE
jgi:hypothetical protein